MTRSFSAVLILAVCGYAAAADEHPLSAEKRDELRKACEQMVEQGDRAIARDAERVENYSRRGDGYFFLGRFQEAVADYDKMVELDPNLENSHWRRGIACFYAGEFARAAKQFEIYDTIDHVDRENGIWRYFSQVKARGVEKARGELLKYEKDDREPFPAVYKLFSAEIASEQILRQIHEAKIDDAEREKRLFYAQLYIGLNHAVRDEQKPAVEHLRKAVANTWAPKGGYGPNFMWQVGRLQYELLVSKSAQKDGDAPKDR
ncbi:MAG: tetratricopeptide repeat protein [Planctomycetaceae bacterium]